MGCRTRRETNKSPAKEVSDTALSIALVTDSMADLPPAGQFSFHCTEKEQQL